MKTIIIKTIVLLSAVSVICGCEDFLTCTPYDATSSEQAFGSSTQAEAVLAGVYSNLSYDYTGTSILNWDAFAGVIDPSAEGGLTGSYLYLTGKIQPNNDMFLTWWKRFYEGINRANDVIEHIDQVPDMSASLKACRMAEAKFLRAYHYYRLNSLYRGVPVYLKNLGTADYTKARSSEEEVWNVIIDDCTDCIACKSLPDKYAATDGSFGRVTKGAAYMLRGKAYMWLKNWSAAEADFRAVMSMGYCLPDGVSYADLFTEKNEKCDEIIFSWCAENVSGCGNVFSRTYGNWDTAGNGNNTFYMSTDFVDSYECKDGKPFNWDDFFPGYSSMTPVQRSVYFCRDSLYANEASLMASTGVDMGKYLEGGNEARLKAVFENRDPRLLATVITPYSEYLGGFYGEELTYVFRYPYRTDETGAGNDLRTRRSESMLYCPRKFVSTGRTYTEVTYNPVDVPIFRYADLLLLLAEAINEQGPSKYTEAMQYVNQVRTRAGVALLGSNTWTTVSSQDDMRRRIRNEKRWELALEEVLFTEELRWGTLKESRFGTNAGLKECFGKSITSYSFGGDYYLKWAIPSSEVQKNNKLLQNPEWL